MKKGQTRNRKTYGLKHQDGRNKPRKRESTDVTSDEFIERDKCIPRRDMTEAEIAEYEKGLASLATTSPFGIRTKGPNVDTFPG